MGQTGWAPRLWMPGPCIRFGTLPKTLSRSWKLQALLLWFQLQEPNVIHKLHCVAQKTYALDDGKTGFTAVLTAAVLLRTLLLLDNHHHVKLATDAKWKDLFAKWCLMPLRALSKEYDVSRQAGAKLPSETTHVSEVIFAASSSDCSSSAALIAQCSPNFITPGSGWRRALGGWGQPRLASHPHSPYCFQLPPDIARQQDRLTDPVLTDDGRVLCARWWAAYAQIQPGGASGTQSVEAYHASGHGRL